MTKRTIYGNENLTQHDYDETTGGCSDCFETVPILEMDEYGNCSKCQDKYIQLEQGWSHKGIMYQFNEIRFHSVDMALDSQETAKLQRVFKDRLEYISVELKNDTGSLLVWACDLI